MSNHRQAIRRIRFSPASGVAYASNREKVGCVEHTVDCKTQLCKRHVLADSGTDLVLQQAVALIDSLYYTLTGSHLL